MFTYVYSAGEKEGFRFKKMPTSPEVLTEKNERSVAKNPRKFEGPNRILMMDVEKRGLSKLERYLFLMNALANWNSISQKQLTHMDALNLVSKKNYLTFLVKLNLVTETTVGNRTEYSITPKGQRVCIYFRVMKNKSIFFGTRIDRID